MSFTPIYSGVSGSAISFQVVNELAPTTSAGPYSLNLYTDNPTISLRATQNGTPGEASFSYNWLAACNPGGRQGAPEEDPSLAVTVLRNPVEGETVAVVVSGAAGQPLHLQVVDERGNLVSKQVVDGEQSGFVQLVRIGQQAGHYIPRVSTPTQNQTTKILKR